MIYKVASLFKNVMFKWLKLIKLMVSLKTKNQESNRPKN